MAGFIEVKGLVDVEARLLQVGKLGGAKAMRQALFFATKPILEAAKARIRSWPGGSGALHESMGRTFRMGPRGDSTTEGGTRFVMLIGPRKRVPRAVALHNLAYGRKVRGIFYGHLLEFGHRIGHRGTGDLRKPGAGKRPRRITRSAGAGQVAAQRFLAPALGLGARTATAVFQQQLGIRLTRALRKQDPGT